MPPRTSRLRAWAELFRLSNLPTVVSNALAGTALALAPRAAAAAFPWRSAGWISAGAGCLYLAGMALNDACDASVDRQERPGRPIPSGRISRLVATIAGLLLLLAGLNILALAGRAPAAIGAALVILIVLYDTTHRFWSGSVVLLGLCRAGVYLAAGAAVVWPPDSPWLLPGAGLLGGYVVALSLIARHEAGRPARIRIVIALLCGISILDALVLALLQQWLPVVAALGCYFLARLAQRWIRGT